MATFRFNDTELQVTDGDTVLDTLLRHGIDVPSSCRAGVCQACMLRCEEGMASPESQASLKETLRARGYFLACQCPAQDGIRVSLGDTEKLFVAARVVCHDQLAARICRLRLETDQPLDYYAGQFVHLRRPDGLVRPYSLASVPQSKSPLELHVTRRDGGKMSTWVHEDLDVGTQAELRGPSGDCFYLPGRPEQPLLLIGTGCGLAPLYGILRTALASEHRGEIHLYHGSYRRDGLYLVEELRELDRNHGNFAYHPCVDEGDFADIRNGRAHDVAFADHKDLTGWRIFLCGRFGMVKSAKKLAYLAGADLACIFSDAFEPSPC